MGRKIIRAAVLLTFLFCLCASLSSCLDTNVNVKLKVNGGTVDYTYKISDSLVKTIFNGTLPLSFEDCVTENIKNETYYVKRESFTARSNDELESLLKSLSFFGEEGVYLFSDVHVEPYHIILVSNTNIFSEEVIQKAEALSVDINKLIYINVTIKMPSKVTEHNKGHVLPDGKTVSCSFEGLTEQASLEIRSKNTAVEIFIFSAVSLILLFISLIVIIIIKFIEKRKEKEAERMPAIPVDTK